MNEFEEIAKHSEGWQAFLKFKSALIEQDPNYEIMPENIMLYIYSHGKVSDFTRWQDICPILDKMLLATDTVTPTSKDDTRTYSKGVSKGHLQFHNVLGKII